MEADLDRAIKPAKKIRKLVKSFPDDPSPEEVHALRTQARRLEANIHALFPDEDAEAQKLLKAMKPLRKAAGKVRDMDVLIGKAMSLNSQPEQEPVITLVEHMARTRREHVLRLKAKIAIRRPKIRKLLKRYIRRVEDSVAANRGEESIHGVATELEHWPKLHRGNLHEFRIRAKELRYMLQLEKDGDHDSIEAFGRVKDTAGDWHDWLELLNVAQDVLDPKEDGTVLKTIRDTLREKLRVALTTANTVRKKKLFELAA